MLHVDFGVYLIQISQIYMTKEIFNFEKKQVWSYFMLYSGRQCMIIIFYSFRLVHLILQKLIQSTSHPNY
jgi:hypothetical protein